MSATKKQNSQAEEELKAAKRTRISVIIAVVVIILAILAAIFINSNFAYTHTTAMTIGNTKYSPAEVNVFYRSAYNSTYNMYYQFFGDSASTYMENMSSEEILATAQQNMIQVTALCDEAAKNGYTFSAEDQAELDSEISSLQLNAAMYGFSSLDQFLGLNYGQGVNEKVLRSVMKKMILADSYSAQKRESFTYDASALSAYYTEHADDLDIFYYYVYTVSTYNAAFDEITEESEKLTAAHEAAEKIADAATPEEFAANAAEFAEGTELTEQHTAGSGLSSTYKEWMLQSHTYGETTVIDTDSSAVALMFTGRSENQYSTVNMRHILISVEADEEGNYTEEAKNAAEAKLDEVIAQYNAAPSEEKFAELANANTTDPGNNNSDGTQNGGLYENIARYSMVSSIDSFLFDPATKAGDTYKVYEENSNYRGWHFVYFVGENEGTYADTLSENALRSADYTTWLEGLTSAYSAVPGSGIKYVNM